MQRHSFSIGRGRRTGLATKLPLYCRLKLCGVSDLSCRPLVFDWDRLPSYPGPIHMWFHKKVNHPSGKDDLKVFPEGRF